MGGYPGAAVPVRKCADRCGPSVGMIGRGAAMRLRADVLAAGRIGAWADSNGRASGKIRWRLVESI